MFGRFLNGVREGFLKQAASTAELPKNSSASEDPLKGGHLPSAKLPDVVTEVEAANEGKQLELIRTPDASEEVVVQKLPETGTITLTSHLPVTPLPDSINVRSDNPDTAILSNYAHTPFSLDGVAFQAIEGFIYFIKIPSAEPELSYSQFERALRAELKQLLNPLKNSKEKHEWKHARKIINNALEHNLSAMYEKIEHGEALNDKDRVFVYWQNEKIQYGTDQHHSLIKRAISAKFDQNPDALDVLIETWPSKLVHEVGDGRFTSLPATVFCKILTDIREETVRKIVD